MKTAISLACAFVLGTSLAGVTLAEANAAPYRTAPLASGSETLVHNAGSVHLYVHGPGYYPRHRHHRRYRRHRRYYGGYLHVYPPIVVVPQYSPRYSNRCDYWSVRCRRNWGYGSNYRGCMRYHRCW